MRKLLLLVFCFFCVSYVSGQEKAIRWSLAQCIERAAAGSLDAFKAKNLYLSGYWGYRSCKAGRLPSVSFQFSPMQYTNSITQRYDYNQNIDVYRQQQNQWLVQNKNTLEFQTKGLYPTFTFTPFSTTHHIRPLFRFL